MIEWPQVVRGELQVGYYEKSILKKSGKVLGQVKGGVVVQEMCDVALRDVVKQSWW